MAGEGSCQADAVQIGIVVAVIILIILVVRMASAGLCADGAGPTYWTDVNSGESISMQCDGSTAAVKTAAGPRHVRVAFPGRVRLSDGARVLKRGRLTSDRRRIDWRDGTAWARVGL